MVNQKDRSALPTFTAEPVDKLSILTADRYLASLILAYRHLQLGSRANIRSK